MAVIKGIIDHGSNGSLVNVECHISNSLPLIVIVGLTNRSVSEARERIRGAMAHSNIPMPRKRITLNLAPADIPKDGSGFDLAMVLSILTTANMVLHPPDQNTVVIGEVSLSGAIRPVRGIIGKILSAKKLGIHTFWIPYDNLEQASLIPDIQLRSFKTIDQLFKELNAPYLAQPLNYNKPPLCDQTVGHPQIQEVTGQHVAKRALLIAAAGHHNIILNGPPGVGKTILAKALPGILPPLSQEEILEATHIHSLASKTFDQLISTRPFRSPHHSSTTNTILGGGQSPTPGEISLSHNGVLLLDEFPEFSRSVIESLRQPLENHYVSISRSRETVRYPAHFLLVATANPCPCGFAGTDRCVCLPSQLYRYSKKLSGPVIDRIDLQVDLEAVPRAEIIQDSNDTITSSHYKDLVTQARQRQMQRNGRLNSTLTNTELKDTALLSAGAKKLLDHGAQIMSLSARGYIRCIKVARTIADLEQSPVINEQHIGEALQYRKKPLPKLTSVT